MVFEEEKAINTTEKIPTPKEDRNDTTEFIMEENREEFTIFIFLISCSIAVSILKFSPRDGKVLIKKSFISLSGMAIDCTEVSTLTREISLIIPVIIGIRVATVARKMDIIIIMVSIAYIHDGSFLPLISIFSKRIITGLPINETTAAASI